MTYSSLIHPPPPPTHTVERVPTATSPPGPLATFDPKIRLHGGGGGSVAELAQLRLGFHVTWPLGMLLDDNVLQQYNAVTVFLMQVLSGWWWVGSTCIVHVYNDGWLLHAYNTQ